MRISKSKVFFRACVGVFLVYLFLGSFWNWAADQSRWSVMEMAISAVLTVVVYGGIAWMITRIGMWLLYGGNRDYQRYRESGGDPFFDSLPKSLNPTPETDRLRSGPDSGSDDDPARRS